VNFEGLDVQLLIFFKKEEKARRFKLDTGNMHANFLRQIELTVRAILKKYYSYS
jgi:hypothetical protein